MKVVIVTKDEAPSHAPISSIGGRVLGMYSARAKSKGQYMEEDWS